MNHHHNFRENHYQQRIVKISNQQLKIFQTYTDTCNGITGFNCYRSNSSAHAETREQDIFVIGPHSHISACILARKYDLGRKENIQAQVAFD